VGGIASWQMAARWLPTGWCAAHPFETSSAVHPAGHEDGSGCCCCVIRTVPGVAEMRLKVTAAAMHLPSNNNAITFSSKNAMLF
jgi:hypothetical protein